MNKNTILIVILFCIQGCFVAVDECPKEFYEKHRAIRHAAEKTSELLPDSRERKVKECVGSDEGTSEIIEAFERAAQENGWRPDAALEVPP